MSSSEENPQFITATGYKKCARMVHENMGAPLLFAAIGKRHEKANLMKIAKTDECKQDRVLNK